MTSPIRSALLLRAFTILLIAAMLLPSPAMACLWDYDTLQQERDRFPSSLELITGKFPRHSLEFYQWRIKDRLKKIDASGPSAEWLDDLAVAYDKTGQHDEAIATMKRAEQLFPGRYETAANLGTLYFHAQRLQEGIPHIKRALQINPEAHFGREKYQLLLVKYVLSKQVDGKTPLPLAKIDNYGEVHDDGFRNFVLRDVPYEQQRAELERAIKGVLGMMRFGKHDSPILLEALGDLLTGKHSDDSKEQQLAVRAFLQACYVTANQPEVSGSYRRRAEKAIGNQVGGNNESVEMKIHDLEPVFQKELAESADWFAELQRRESEWLVRDLDPDARFAAAYSTEPVVSDFTGQKASRYSIEDRLMMALGIVGAFFLLAIGAFFYGIRWYLRGQRELRQRIEKKTTNPVDPSIP